MHRRFFAGSFGIFWLSALAWGAAAEYPASKHGGTYMFNYYIPPAPSTTPWAPAWSPDGKWIAVGMYGSIWKVDPKTGVAFELTYNRELGDFEKNNTFEYLGVKAKMERRGNEFFMTFTYPDGKSEINALHVPVGRPVALVAGRPGGQALPEVAGQLLVGPGRVGEAGGRAGPGTST